MVETRSDDTLAAITCLLDGAHLAAGHELSDLVATAGRRLGPGHLDGVERLGVLGIELGPDVDPQDHALRDQCRWLASLTGHLIAVKGTYGDSLDLPRR